MSNLNGHNAPVAIVGLAAIMPQAPDADAFWANLKNGRYSITEVPPGRWDPALYFDEDHAAPDKTYSKIGGWVREFAWDPIRWKLPVPPKVAEQMDEGQRWAVSAARSALVDAGWPGWKVDSDRVAVIIGNAIGGEKHYRSSMRVELAEVLAGLAHAPSLAALAPEQRDRVVAETRSAFLAHCGEITEDTMPGELSNVMAGRIANLFNFRGPNFTADAACASGLAAMSAAVEGLIDHRFDAVITGGVDRNMGVAGFVKFCKIGALSATGTRPFDAGADGFVMGEGAALFVLKRLEDAERDGDRIYAVILGIAGSSDGKGKGITAPNPIGQQLAVKRAWELAAVDPASVTAIEAHGTSTRVGDATELESLTAVFGGAGAPAHAIALGSVKSNIGHLKAAAGTAGLFKMARSLHEKVLVPSLNFRDPNPNVDWDRSPFQVNTRLREWARPPCGVRRGGVSAFGFGGTNFHVALEEHLPGRYKAEPRAFGNGAAQAAPGNGAAAAAPSVRSGLPVRLAADPHKAPPRGALVLGGRDEADLVAQLGRVLAEAKLGRAPALSRPDPAVGRAPMRVAVDHVDAADLAAKLDKLVKAFAARNPAVFRMLRQQGVFVGRGPAPKVAFLYTGQGSQYANMLAELRSREPIVAETFRQADTVMTPLLGRSLSSYIFIDGNDPAAVAQLERELRQTEITQPALLATDASLHRLLAAYGMTPDMVMGHSLGEYGALVAAGSLTFEAALEAVSARGREMSHLKVADNGAMAAVSAPLTEIEKVVAETPGYVVVANINSTSQAVIGGATAAVEAAMQTLAARGLQATRIPVSHAFHTSIVAPAAVPLVATLERLAVQPPRIPLVANVTGEFYPADATPATMRELLGKQVASPVQFVKGLQTLYDAGARVFVEIGPKRALHGFVEDVLGGHDDVWALFTNHPKQGDIGALNQALCGLWAAGLGFDVPQAAAVPPAARVDAPRPATVSVSSPVSSAVSSTMNATVGAPPAAAADTQGDRVLALGRIIAGAIEQGLRLYRDVPGGSGAPAPAPAAPAPTTVAAHAALGEPIVITGAALGLPGVERVFDDANIGRILAGQQMIGAVPDAVRARMVDMHITRLVKNEIGGATFEAIDDPSEVVKLAGRHAPFDVVQEFAVDSARDEALDVTTRLAIGAGFDALRDAGIPLVMRYKTTTLGTQLPDRWGLPDSLRDDTGVIFASAFPGYDNFGRDVEAYAADRARREHLLALEAVRARMPGNGADTTARAEVDKLIATLRAEISAHPYQFDRRFLFQALSMGHAQFAEIIGARGPNTQVNAACASTTQTLAIAEDWIRASRCRRVIVIAADDATSDVMLPWIASGFLASGAAATDAHVEDAATPFDRRRHGMIVGMGAAAFVIESADAARERGLQPICEVLGSVIANSAYHGTRLDVEHIGAVMEALLRQAGARGVVPEAIAAQTVFVSHETYTPARGGSASAEIAALRRVFGAAADRVVITNTKGFTGHAMGAGIEDVVAIKALETGVVPPVPNYREPDPELGALNLSRGGAHDVRYALRLAAGFGSQIAMSLLRWTPMPDGAHRAPAELGHAYRIADRAAWQRWLDDLAGHGGAQLEVEHRRLRLVDRGAPAASHHASAVPVPYAGRVPAGAGDALAMPPAVTGVVVAQPYAAPASATRSTPAAAPAAPAVAAVAAAAAPSTAPAPAVASPADAVLTQVTALVSQLTGYPSDLLDADLDLEADLGVDTVKQAEVFAAVRGHYNVERDPNLKLRDFPTLRHVATWVRERAGLGAAPAAASAPMPAPAAGAMAAAPATPAQPAAPVASATTAAQRVAPPAAAAATAAATDDVIARVTAIVAEMTGYPVDLLEPDLDLEADLGVDTVKQAEVFAAVRGHYNVERDPNLKLRDFPTLRHVSSWVRERAGLAAPAAQELPTPTAAASSAAPAAATAAASAAATAATPAATTAAPSADEVIEQVRSIVAQMTGYPTDLLEPDLDLEADLGIDTVKQAEVFANVRGHYHVERDPNLKLRDFPTLRHVARWVRERSAGAATAAAATAAASPAAAKPAAPPVVQGDLRAVDALPRRLPMPSLRPPAKQCLPTGVKLGSARVVVMADEGGVAKALVKKLAKAGAEVLELAPGLTTEALSTQLAQWQAAGPIAGVYWLPALDAEGDLSAMDLAAWREALRRRVKTLYTTMRALFDASPFLVAATRLGGRHGYDPEGATHPMGGAVVGFAKSYRKERPDASIVKAVDFADAAKAAAVADQLMEETLCDPGCVEIGRSGEQQRVGIAFVEAPLPALDDQTAVRSGTALGKDSVFVVTGAAGSIVSAITADLAVASGGTFHLLDLTPAPDRNDRDVAAFRSDRDGLKATLAQRLKAAGEKATPVAIERELARLERLSAALTAVQAVEAAGGRAHYHSVDLTQADAVARVMAEVRAASGRIDVLLHAAGLEISRNLPEKEPREFDLVFDVKSDGWFNVIRGAGDLPIGAAIVFSSVAGRFGNQGQTDYAAANDLLCKITSHWRRSRPPTRAIALDWTAWGGIGMATRGSIPKIMEMAGVQMLPPEAGVAWIRRELLAGAFRGEVIVAGELGLMAAELHASGGVDPALFAKGKGPMLGSAKLSVHDGLVVQTTLDPARQPFLHDHRIDGTPVLPAVMGIEAFAEAARLLAPEHRVVALENLAFTAPLKFYRDEPRTVTVQVLLEPAGDELLAHAKLMAERMLPGQERPQRTVHFTGTVRLALEAPKPEKAGAAAPGPDGRPPLSAEQVYSLYFHGPAYQVVGSAWRADGLAVAALASPLPPNHEPAELPLATAPRLVELCFQAAGLWEAGLDGRLALPTGIGRVRLLADPAALKGALHATARPVAAGRFDCRVLDAKGRVVLALDDYRSIPLPAPIPAPVAAMLRDAFEKQPG
jgi:acyl transferase domain-containing protein